MDNNQLSRIRKKIQKGMEDRKNLPQYKAKLKLLKENPDVKKESIIELREIIKQTQIDHQEYMYIFGKKGDTIENRVYEEYKTAYIHSECTEIDNNAHKLWIYLGSYYIEQLDLDEDSSKVKSYQERNSENLGTNFSHNKYLCLACGKKIDVKDWQTFEQTHKVLKNQWYQVNIEFYQRMLYMFLYQGYSEEAAFEMVTRKFIEDKYALTTGAEGKILKRIR